MLLILAIILLIIAIAGGVIVHPILFALAIVALVLFFTWRRGAAYSTQSRVNDPGPARAAGAPLRRAAHAPAGAARASARPP